MRTNDDPTRAFADTEKAIVGLARAWLAKYPRGCDFCRVELKLRDMREYVRWCLDLGKHLHPREKLPEPKVFCNDCALTAIPELLRLPVETVPF